MSLIVETVLLEYPLLRERTAGVGVAFLLAVDVLSVAGLRFSAASFVSAMAPRGQPRTIKEFQQNWITGCWGEDYIKCGADNSKKKTLVDTILLDVLAKYGILDPWRNLEEDIKDPAPGADIAGGTGELTDAEIHAKKTHMREVRCRSIA